MHYFDEFICYEGRDGRAVHFFTDPGKLEAHLLELAPQDARPIHEFADALRALGDFDLPLDLSPDDASEGLDFGRVMLGHALPMLRWLNVSVCDFACRFSDPLLREALSGFFQCTPPDFPMLMLLMTLAPMGAHTSGYPLGGSLMLAEAMARRYLSLGGKVDYGARVVEILTNDDHAAGVRLADGCVYYADVVISAADGRSTIYDLLGGRYDRPAIHDYYANLPVAESIVQVSLGVRRDFSHLPPALAIPVSPPIDVGGRLHDRLVLKHYCFDPAMADPGKSVLSIWCEADYDHWLRLRADDKRYAAEKARVGQAVVAALDRRFPGLASAVEVIDVATPTTFEHYTANWRGSIHGWALGAQKMNFMMRMGMSKVLPGLSGFYMIGQWVEPAGNVQLSAASGRDVIEMICRQRQWTFQTTNAPDPASLG